MKAQLDWLLNKQIKEKGREENEDEDGGEREWRNNGREKRSKRGKKRKFEKWEKIVKKEKKEEQVLQCKAIF